MWSISLRENGRIEFKCSCGVGHYPCWYDDTLHGCCGCCHKESFPGRKPRKGDLAVCGAGSLGIILSARKKTIHYPNGNTVVAWYGVSLLNGQPWSSRNPIILGQFSQLINSRLPQELTCQLKKKTDDLKAWCTKSTTEPKDSRTGSKDSSATSSTLKSTPLRLSRRRR